MDGGKGGEGRREDGRRNQSMKEERQDVNEGKNEGRPKHDVLIRQSRRFQGQRFSKETLSMIPANQIVALRVISTTGKFSGIIDQIVFLSTAFIVDHCR